MLRPTCHFKFEEDRPKTSNELLKFNLCRQKFEKRLKELGDEAAEKFDPIVHWMRLFIADKAPELLNEPYPNK